MNGKNQHGLIFNDEIESKGKPGIETVLGWFRDGFCA